MDVLYVLHPVRVAVQRAHAVFERAHVPNTHGRVIGATHKRARVEESGGFGAKCNE